MKISKVKLMTITAMLAALVFVVTRFIQIPIPLGYFNIGNSVILLGCLNLPLGYGMFVGGVGSAIADLTSYPVYTIPTLLIKAVMVLVYQLMNKIPIKNTMGRAILASAVATLIPLFGYTIVGGFLYGGFVAGLAQFPGLFLEYLANLVIFTALYKPVSKIFRLS